MQVESGQEPPIACPSYPVETRPDKTARQLAPRPRAAAAMPYAPAPPAPRFAGAYGEPRVTCTWRGPATAAGAPMAKLHSRRARATFYVSLPQAHEPHLIARAAPSRPGSMPSSSERNSGSASYALSRVCRRGRKPAADDLWRKGARKDEQMRCDDVGVGSTNDVEGRDRLQHGHRLNGGYG